MVRAQPPSELAREGLALVVGCEFELESAFSVAAITQVAPAPDPRVQMQHERWTWTPPTTATSTSTATAASG